MWAKSTVEGVIPTIGAIRASIRVTLAALVVVPFSAPISRGVAQDRFTQEELNALPRVCLAQEHINQSLARPVVPEEERRAWAKQLGKPYGAFHHYCWGLIDMRRASVTRGNKQAHHYRSAVGNFEYVERHSDADFPLYPELLLRKGMALRLLNRDADAADAFARSILAKRDYTPAYAALIDLNVDLGDMKGARYVLEEGLRQAPNSEILLNKKEELDSEAEEPR